MCEQGLSKQESQLEVHDIVMDSKYSTVIIVLGFRTIARVNAVGFRLISKHLQIRPVQPEQLLPPRLVKRVEIRVCPVVVSQTKRFQLRHVPLSHVGQVLQILDILRQRLKFQDNVVGNITIRAPTYD